MTSPPAGRTPAEASRAAADAVREAASALIEASVSRYRAKLYAPSSANLPTQWSYLPGDRAGGCLEAMTAEQAKHVDSLMAASLGASGQALVRAAMATERHRRELATGRTPDGDRYWIRIHGDPAGAQGWGWQLNGHHLAVHIWVTDEVVSVTPHFIGAEPATIGRGPATGTRILGTVEDLARELMHSLGGRQRSLAVYSSTPPADIHTRAEPIANPNVVPDGVPYVALSPAQKTLCGWLIRCYLSRAPQPYATACWTSIISRPDRISFAWAGGWAPGERNYHCVKTDTSLFEYDNSQDAGNHAHSVWRHLDHDYGSNLLADHYQSSRERQPDE